MNILRRGTVVRRAYFRAFKKNHRRRCVFFAKLPVLMPVRLIVTRQFGTLLSADCFTALAYQQVALRTEKKKIHLSNGIIRAAMPTTNHESFPGEYHRLSLPPPAVACVLMYTHAANDKVESLQGRKDVSTHLRA